LELAVDYPLVAVADGPCLQGGQVRPRAGLGIEGAPGVIEVCYPRHEPLFLLLGSVDHQRRAHPGNAHVEAGGRAGIGHLFVVDHLGHYRSARAAVLLRPGERDPAPVRQLLLELLREVPLRSHSHLALGVELLVPAGGQLRAEELLYLGAERLFFIVESKVHNLLYS